MAEEEQSFIAYHAASIRKNWRTFTVAVVTSVASYIAMFPDGFDAQWVNIARFVMVGGLASFGVVAKDASVTGTAHTSKSYARNPNYERRVFDATGEKHAFYLDPTWEQNEPRVQTCRVCGQVEAHPIHDPSVKP